MAIIIDQSKSVLVQGITGREGRARTRLMRGFGTNVVALDGIDLETCIAATPGVVHASHTVGDDTSLPLDFAPRSLSYQANR